MIQHPSIDMAGASPDGLVGTDGLLEIKCPNSATHADTLLYGKPSGDYVLQMQWQLACTGRKWCDFVSYDPRMPQHLQLFIKRFERDDAKIADYEHAVLDFLAEVDALMLKLPTIQQGQSDPLEITESDVLA
jgi:predicted phage-related endonuclease